MWAEGLRRIAPAEPVAMVSVLATEGSAPRGAGTRMLVTRAAGHGTIGGGRLELVATQQAREILAQPAGSWRVQDYPLGPLLGQCCGGRVRLLVERIDPAALGWLDDVPAGGVLETRLDAASVARAVVSAASAPAVSARGEKPGVGARLVEALADYARPLWLFGAGHVGQAIAAHAARLPLRLAWFDTRAAFAGIAGVAHVDAERIADCVAEAPDDAAILILTHDHGLDYALTLAALRRGPVAYVGLIGSATKRARFWARLARDGVGADALGRLTCPIGVPGVTGKEPDVIAIAVLAQVLQLAPAADHAGVAARRAGAAGADGAARTRICSAGSSLAAPVNAGPRGGGCGLAGAALASDDSVGAASAHPPATGAIAAPDEVAASVAAGPTA